MYNSKLKLKIQALGRRGKQEQEFASFLGVEPKSAPGKVSHRNQAHQWKPQTWLGFPCLAKEVRKKIHIPSFPRGMVNLIYLPRAGEVGRQNFIART